jgi:hypothetical protein
MAAADPRFDINIYQTGLDGKPLAVPTLPGYAPFPSSIGVKIPPQFDAVVPPGFSFTMCERPAPLPFANPPLPSTFYSLVGVTITVTGGPNAGTTHPAIYYVAVPLTLDPNNTPLDPSDDVPNPMGGTYGCFNTTVPQGATEFAVNLDNSRVCTYTQGGWGSTPHGNNPGQILSSNFSTVYPGGFVEIGGNALDSLAPWGLRFTSAAAIGAFLPHGGTAAALTALNGDTVNPTGGPGTFGGVFGGQVLALQLNRDFGAANIFGNGGGIGAFTVNYPTCYPSSTPTVSQVLADANLVLSGGANPTACTISQLNDLVDKLNNSFDNCVAGPDAVILNPPLLQD